jgi:ATP/maltotriose-dependent transcriptional regulator MalT
MSHTQEEALPGYHLSQAAKQLNLPPLLNGICTRKFTIKAGRKLADDPDLDLIGFIALDREQKTIVVFPNSLRQKQPPAGLSKRELEILALVVKGWANAQISQQLVISRNTVKVHLRNIFEKIQVQSRTEVAILAI